MTVNMITPEQLEITSRNFRAWPKGGVGKFENGYIVKLDMLVI